MNIPQEFDPIRPYEPEELHTILTRLFANPDFERAVAFVLPDVPFEMVKQKAFACKTSLDIQKAFFYDIIGNLLKKASTGCHFRFDLPKDGRYTFVSNHRDIVLDSAILDRLLIEAGFETTCEIAIGDNLLSLPWVKDLVRVNKSFIVERNLPLRQLLISSKRLADYMHFAISRKHENVWIAQREGRAKDSNDKTEESILKMMAMGGTGNPAERLSALNIVPLAISYEYDPCDYLKAQEFQLKRDDPAWKKSAEDDIHSMYTGIFGFKGRINYVSAAPINDFLAQVDAETDKVAFFTATARHIDREIHRNYVMYPCNYVAADLLSGQNTYAASYTASDKQTFFAYIEQQLAKITLPSPDLPFLRERMLTMYANPLYNHLAAQ